MDIVLGVIFGLLALTVLITAHEFGHFLAARRSGVRVKEFGIGFPPRAVAWVRSKPEKGKKKGKWHRIPRKDWQKEQKSLIFSLNFLPIGGFCAMDGESDDETRPGTFGSVSFWKKTKILFAGVGMNWLIAFIVLTALCWTGMPEIMTNQFSIKSDEILSTDSSIYVGEVKGGSPAEKAGFMVNDAVISAISAKDAEMCTRAGAPIDGNPTCDEEHTKIFYSSSDVIDFNNAHVGEDVIYSVKRLNTQECVGKCLKKYTDENLEARKECIDECSTLTEESNLVRLNVTLNSKDDEYLLGITMSSPNVTRRYTWSAPITAAGLTIQLTGETFKGLGKLVADLFTGAIRQVSSDESIREEGKQQLAEASEGVSGIVGIIGYYFPGLMAAGPTMVFLFIAIISISLACMNVLPIPALDGGRWFMIAFCRLRHKKLSKEKEQAIVARAFIFLIILMLIVTIMDIIKLF